MTVNFNTLPWHDANLKSILIDRKSPGENDTVMIKVEWPDEIGHSIIEFFDCYGFIANMNFGFVASESVLTANCVEDSKEVLNIRTQWLKMGVNLQSLKCFKIFTNTTGSEISIICQRFTIRNDVVV